MPFDPPTTDLTVEDLKRRYGISKQTLYARKNASQITGKHIRGKTYFTPEEVWCFDQVATFVERGMTLPQIEKLVHEWKAGKPEADVTAGIEQDITAGQAEPDLQVLTTPPFDAMSVGVPPAPDSDTEATERNNALAKFAEREEQAHQLARAFTTAVGQALQDTQHVVADPLRTHRLLAEAAREEWVLTNAQLAEICGLSGSTISGLRPSAVRCGFVLTAIGINLWDVRKASRDELMAEQESKKRSKPIPPWRAKLEKAEEGLTLDDDT